MASSICVKCGGEESRDEAGIMVQPCDCWVNCAACGQRFKSTNHKNPTLRCQKCLMKLIGNTKPGDTKPPIVEHKPEPAVVDIPVAKSVAPRVKGEKSNTLLVMELINQAQFVKRGTPMQEILDFVNKIEQIYG